MKQIVCSLIVAFSMLSCSQNVSNDAVASCHENGGRCTGSKSCTACKNCTRCKHCNAGGTCGVCK